MNTEEITKKMRMIMTEQELSKIRIMETGEQVVVTVDLHGLSCSEARRFINNTICLIKQSFVFRIIHGYNHGTALKDMIWDNLANSRVKEKKNDLCNPGLTYLSITYA